MNAEDDDTRFYGHLMSLIALECRTPAHGVLGFAEQLLSGDGDDEQREAWLKHIRDNGERLVANMKILTLASRTALGVLNGRDFPTVNARQIADRAQASLAEEDAATVTVSGEGVPVLADEWLVEPGFAAIVRRIASHGDGLNARVDGAEITLSPAPTDDYIRSFVIGDDQAGGSTGLVVRVIRGLGGSVDLDGDSLRFRFPEPQSPEAGR